MGKKKKKPKQELELLTRLSWHVVASRQQALQPHGSDIPSIFPADALVQQFWAGWSSTSPYPRPPPCSFFLLNLHFLSFSPVSHHGAPFACRPVSECHPGVQTEGQTPLRSSGPPVLAPLVGHRGELHPL